MILAAVDDLFFLAKIRQTAGVLALAIEQVDPGKIEERVAQGHVRAIILDLNHRSGTALETLRALKANLATRQLPVLGFVSHVQSDIIDAARAAGCDQVLARSAFAGELPRLLAKLSGKAAAE
jgi:CheY-like chemotaxis protein